MKDGSTKFFLGLILGAAAGAAATYLAQAEKREQLMSDLNEIADKVKDSIETYRSVVDERIGQLKESATDKFNSIKGSVNDTINANAE